MIRLCALAAVVVAAFVFSAQPAGASPAVAIQGHRAAPQVPHGPTHVGKPTHTGKPANPGKSGTAPHGKMTPAQHLAKSPQLARRVAALLPPGTDVQAAADGFKNLGQFVAAAHVSHNLGISFDQLKGLMTGPKAESLGKAVQALQPAAPKDAVKQAENEAKDDLKQTSAK